MNDIEDSHFHPDSVGKSHVPIQCLKRTKSKGSAVKGKLSMFSVNNYAILPVIHNQFPTRTDAMATKDTQRRLIKVNKNQLKHPKVLDVRRTVSTRSPSSDLKCTMQCKFQPTVVGSSTEAEFMAAYDTGKMILFIRSVLWDLHVPQEAATVLFEDNDGCTAMGNAQKPTTRTRHMDIKYFSLCEWVERDLMILERIDTSINMSDHMTKGLQTILILFHRHVDFLLGHIPPMYSPIYASTIGTYSNHTVNIDHFTPPSFTTPTTVAAARVHAPILSNYRNSPWLRILGHGLNNPHIHRLSHILCSNSIVDCGRVAG